MDRLELLAKQVDLAATNANPIKQLSLEHDFTLDEAYDIQRMMIEERMKRGEKVVGLKMGFTSHAKMEQMGVHDMIWGRLTDRMWIDQEGEVSLAQYIHPRAEPEICFRIKERITEEIALEELHHYVDGMAAAIEIIDSRFENFKFSLEDVVADNCSSIGFVVGKWHEPTRDIEHLSMRLKFDDKEVAAGTSHDILGDPWKALQAATRLASQYGQPIEPGHVVMAGAATAAVFIEPGITVSAEVERLGNVSFNVIA